MNQQASINTNRRCIKKSTKNLPSKVEFVEISPLTDFKTTITNCQNSLMSNGKIEIFAEGSSVPIAINLALQLQIYIGSASLKVIHDTKFCRAKNRSENSFSIPTLKILVINQMDKA